MPINTEDGVILITEQGAEIATEDDLLYSYRYVAKVAADGRTLKVSGTRTLKAGNTTRRVAIAGTRTLRAVDGQRRITA